MNLPSVQDSAKGKSGVDVNVFLPLLKVQIKEVHFPIMEMLYLIEISFSSDPTAEQSTITCFISQWEGREAQHACPWVRKAVFTQ